jgi:hypothetical protein
MTVSKGEGNLCWRYQVEAALDTGLCGDRKMVYQFHFMLLMSLFCEKSLCARSSPWKAIELF